MEALDYNNLTKDALYKILLHANEFFNDPTKLSDGELSSKIKRFNEEFYKREEAKRLKNTKEILMKYYRVEKPQNIPFEVYKK